MTPQYSAQFAKPLVNQLIAVWQRNKKPAVGWVRAARPAGRALQPIAMFYKEAAPVQNWPALVLVAQQTTFDAASDEDLRTQTVRFFCALALTGTDPEWLAEDAMDYLRALDMVLTSASLSDFYSPLPINHVTVPGGTTTPLDPAVSKVQDLFVLEHDLGAMVKARGGALARSPQISFVIEMEER
jgi:hypothetical protein